jgi:hypothetical protein
LLFLKRRLEPYVTFEPRLVAKPDLFLELSFRQTSQTGGIAASPCRPLVRIDWHSTGTSHGYEP